MKEQLITFDTAKLAKEKGFNYPTLYSYGAEEELSDMDGEYFEERNFNLLKESEYWNVSTPTQSLLQKFIRENRRVHIEIHRNASGYYWSMCMEDGGTDLGWSNISGPNDGGVWDSFEDALENALQVQLSYNLPNNIKIIKHWGNYVEFALKIGQK